MAVVTSIKRVGAQITNADTLQYTVTFDEPVTGVTASAFTLNLTDSLTAAPTTDRAESE